ncbi:hypothetical protein CVT25_012787 [Psilocybe cyanescens]|uniref:Uncharacterized protein n=1 Tax=Psilocybe cyanescens TaxID=93625 RepID=A0A409X4F6_PSICY|nr:hypothetical protein CVT25_012787 [Psilocybe cyanescens]
MVQEIQASFPQIDAWLSWWLCPKVASMIFPACNVTDPTVIAQVSRTGNPAEHNHSLLHHAVGKYQDLIPGIKKLFLHVEELERQYNAIKSITMRSPLMNTVQLHKDPTMKTMAMLLTLRQLSIHMEFYNST